MHFFLKAIFLLVGISVIASPFVFDSQTVFALTNTNPLNPASGYSLYTGSAPFESYIVPGDSFMLLSANQCSPLAGGGCEPVNPAALNDLGTKYREIYGDGAKLYAATAGIENIRILENAAKSGSFTAALFNGVMMVWETNWDNSPEFTDCMDPCKTGDPGVKFPDEPGETSPGAKAIWQEAADRIHTMTGRGGVRMEAWLKPTGLVLGNHYLAGRWDLKVLHQIMDGVNYQMQAACAQEPPEDWVEWFSAFLEDIKSVGDPTLATVFSQVTVDPVARTDGARAFECAKLAWAASPMVNKVTVWHQNLPFSMPEAEKFLIMRSECLLNAGSCPAAVPPPSGTPLPGSTVIATPGSTAITTPGPTRPVVIIPPGELTFVPIGVFFNPLKATSIPEFIVNIIVLLLNIALILLPIMVVIGGLMFMFSAGDPAKITRARNLLTWSILGFAVMLLARALVEVVEALLF